MCLSALDLKLKVNFQVEGTKVNKIWLTTTRLELAIFWFEVRRLIHWATRPIEV